jgi:hypothetical protein
MGKLSNKVFLGLYSGLRKLRKTAKSDRWKEALYLASKRPKLLATVGAASLFVISIVVYAFAATLSAPPINISSPAFTSGTAISSAVMNSKFTDIYNYLSNIYTAVNDHATKIDADASNISSLNTTVGSLSGTVSGHGTSITNLQAKGVFAFTSSGTWTVPAGVTTVVIEAVGAGGGGGGGINISNTTPTSGSGGYGGAGGMAKAIWSVSASDSIGITIGAVGTGGSMVNLGSTCTGPGYSASAGSGSNGGDTSVTHSSKTLIAYGGLGGAGANINCTTMCSTCQVYSSNGAQGAVDCLPGGYACFSSYVWDVGNYVSGGGGLAGSSAPTSGLSGSAGIVVITAF